MGRGRTARMCGDTGFVTSAELRQLQVSGVDHGEFFWQGSARIHHLGNRVMAATLKALLTGPHDEYRSDTEYALNILAEYLVASEDALERVKVAASDQLNHEFSEIAGEDQLLIAASHYLEHVGKFGHEFLFRLRYSFVVQLYTVLESRAKALCRELNRRNPKLTLRVNDLRGGRYLEGVRIFLTKVHPVQITRWQEIENLRTIRNCLVHDNGSVLESQSKRRLQAIARSDCGVSTGDDGCLVIERQYCETALASVRGFFKEVFDACGFGSAYSFRRSGNLGVKVETAGGKPKLTLLSAKERKTLQGYSRRK